MDLPPPLLYLVNATFNQRLQRSPSRITQDPLFSQHHTVIVRMPDIVGHVKIAGIFRLLVLA